MNTLRKKLQHKGERIERVDARKCIAMAIDRHLTKLTGNMKIMEIFILPQLL